MPKMKVDFIRPTRRGKHEGHFIGMPAKIHIHILRRGAHIKINGHRTNFDPTELDQVTRALLTLKNESNPNIGGYRNCFNWLYAKHIALGGAQDFLERDEVKSR